MQTKRKSKKPGARSVRLTNGRPAARKPKPMIILRNVPSGYHWGWFTREDQRMHLQPVDRLHRASGCKVWLEQNGRRAFEPVGDIPAKVLKSLRAEVDKSRKKIEDEWTVLMLENRWLDTHLSGSVVILTAYPNTPGSRFARYVDLAEILRGIYDPDSPLAARERKPVKPEEVVLSNEVCAIEIYPQRDESRRHHIYLPPLLWRD